MKEEDAAMISAVMERDRMRSAYERPSLEGLAQSIAILTEDDTVTQEVLRSHWGFLAPENVLTKWEKKKDISRFNNLLNSNILTLKMTKPYYEFDPDEEVTLVNIRMAAIRKFKRSEEGFERQMQATQKMDHTVHAPRIQSSGGILQRLRNKIGR